MTKKIYAKRLLKAADAITTPKLAKHFYFGCHRELDARGKLRACVAGLLPEIFPRFVQAKKVPAYITDVPMRVIGSRRYLDPEMITTQVFNLPEGHARALFTPERRCPSPRAGALSPRATPKQVAKRIRAYVVWAKKEGLA